MKFLRWPLAAALFASPSVAEWPQYDYSNEYTLSVSSPNVSYNEPVLLPLKFNDWYDRLAPVLSDVSTTVCSLSLRAYQGDIAARIELGPVQGYCWVHTNCIMETISERTKASFAGTGVLLGLAPTTLSVLGPSAAEIALLSLHRPLLSVFLSLGAPAIYPGRFLLWDNPIRAHAPHTGAFVVRRFSKLWAIVISISQYLIGIAAGANIFQAAYRIGLRSVSSWSCETSYWPIVWILLSLVVHSTASLSLRTSVKRKNLYIITPNDHKFADPGENGERWKQGGLLPNIIDEFTLSSNRKWQVSDLFTVRLNPIAVGLQYLGAFLSVAHLVFGTLLFSSLFFISVHEAVGLIVRFVASATACRIILQFEVGGMIKVDPARVHKGIVQADEDEHAE